jgi:hypothetical protein
MSQNSRIHNLNTLFLYLADFLELIGADFRHAKNYILNPFENICKDAKFHYPEVLGLLRPFEVQVCD